MRLQAASRREVSRIAIGTLACDGLMIAGLFLLSQFEIGTFDLFKILIGALCGSAIAVINFAILCLTIQSAVGMENQRKMRAKFQTSYNIRLLIQGLWVVGAFFLRSKIHFVAAVAPLVFPKIVILYLQFKGKLLPPSESASPANPQSQSEGDSAQDSAEI